MQHLSSAGRACLSIEQVPGEFWCSPDEAALKKCCECLPCRRRERERERAKERERKRERRREGKREERERERQRERQRRGGLEFEHSKPAHRKYGTPGIPGCIPIAKLGSQIGNCGHRSFRVQAPLNLPQALKRRRERERER